MNKKILLFNLIIILLIIFFFIKLKKKCNKEYFDNQYISDIYSKHKYIDNCDNGYTKLNFDYKKPFLSFCVKKDDEPSLHTSDSENDKRGFITNLKTNNIFNQSNKYNLKKKI